MKFAAGIIGFCVLAACGLTACNPDTANTAREQVRKQALDNVPLGAEAAKRNPSPTLREMLNYALQDEYLARAKYRMILEKYEQQKIFSNSWRTENKVIQALLPLFKKYGIPVPKDNARYSVRLPGSLKQAYALGVQGELDNIAMYERFLKTNVPSDVKKVFSEIRDASKEHLAAFRRGLAQTVGNGK
ncbi:DUF2202 domain-containing protein [Ferviditalea candida]|uniref:DUF2202 domain-containing protein n=1 Tax=Ferviditalea candida TaxID=3108399 RepID=A0ABU5ZIC3_9BACL|nr:hypothetical protein [Paenibacillaceae bacterium T2]